MKRIITAILALSCLGFSALAAVHTEVYRINSGSYIMLGGFAGALTNRLPNAQQMFVELQFDFDRSQAEMRILDEAYQEFQRFSGGRLMGGQILFSNEVPHTVIGAEKVTAMQDYVVQMGNASIWVNGSLTFPARCCDFFTDLIHENVHATLQSGPPPNPIGIYDYRGFDPQGTPIVRGLMSITSRTNPIGGKWRFRGINDPRGIGPQLGNGVLGGSLDGNNLFLDLSPMIADDNVFLNGFLKGDTYRGEWFHSTLLGVMTNGTFIAERRAIRLRQPRKGPDGFVFSCDVGAGLHCVIECTEDAVRGPWKELWRFIGTSEMQHFTHANGLPPGRFYRIRVLDLVDDTN